MKRLKSRRLWVVLAILVGLILVGRWLDRSQPIEGYRVINDRTIGESAQGLADYVNGPASPASPRPLIGSS